MVRVVLLLALCAPAFAQDSPLSVEGELMRVAGTTEQEKVVYVRDALVEMRDAVRSIVRLADVARREGDTESMACVTSRLTTERALLNVAEASEINLKAALAEGRAERADSEFRKVAVALSTGRIALAEAERCVDKSDNPLYPDSAGVVEDTQGVEPEYFDTTDPPPSSPFQ